MKTDESVSCGLASDGVLPPRGACRPVRVVCSARSRSRVNSGDGWAGPTRPRHAHERWYRVVGLVAHWMKQLHCFSSCNVLLLCDTVVVGRLAAHIFYLLWCTAQRFLSDKDTLSFKSPAYTQQIPQRLFRAINATIPHRKLNSQTYIPTQASVGNTATQNKLDAVRHVFLCHFKCLYNIASAGFVKKPLIWRDHCSVLALNIIRYCVTRYVHSH